MIHIKVDAKVMQIEAGWYILVYNPKWTNPQLIQNALSSIDEDAPDCAFVLIPSLDPSSIRLIKTEIPVKVDYGSNLLG